MTDTSDAASPREPSRRTWAGEAKAAFDQSLVAMGERPDFAPPEFWVARAHAAATIELAEQTRIGNLIAWKQLQATRAATRDLGVDLMPLSTTDAATDEIERAIGLEP